MIDFVGAGAMHDKVEAAMIGRRTVRRPLFLLAAVEDAERYLGENRGFGTVILDIPPLPTTGSAP